MIADTVKNERQIEGNHYSGMEKDKKKHNNIVKDMVQDSME
jgi:hypothetical protein